MRGGAEQCRAGQSTHQGLELRLGQETLFGPDAGQMREGLRHRLAGLAVGQNARELEVRMGREQAQQLAGHIAAAAEHDSRDGVRGAHAVPVAATPALPSLAACDAREVRPRCRMR